MIGVEALARKCGRDVGSLHARRGETLRAEPDKSRHALYGQRRIDDLAQIIGPMAVTAAVRPRRFKTVSLVDIG